MNYKTLFIIFSLNVTTALAAEPPLCISLGDSCRPCLVLRVLNLRTEAFPFDWLISPFDSLWQALIQDFEFFFTDIKLAGMHGVVDHYGFTYIHDLPTLLDPVFDPLTIDFTLNDSLHPEWEKAVPAVREKYRRRIDRFRNVFFRGKKIFFFREGVTQEQAILLRDFFKIHYPQLNFVLIVFSQNIEYEKPWNIPYIMNFRFEKWNDYVGWYKTLKKADSAFKHLVRPKKIDIKFYEDELLRKFTEIV